MQRLYNSFRSANINLARKHTKHHQSVEQRAQKAVFEHKLTHSRKFIMFLLYRCLWLWQDGSWLVLLN